MKRLLFAILFLTASAFAQLSSTGSITASGTTCATTNACIVLPLYNTPNFSTTSASAVISGTYTGTLQFESSVDGINFVAISGSALGAGTSGTSTTSTGTWQFNTAALVLLRVRASALASGTAVVTLQAASQGPGASTTTNNSFTGSNTFSKLNNVYVIGNGLNTNLATTVLNAPTGGTVYCPPGYAETDTATIAVNKSLHIILDACTITNNGASTPLFTITASNVTIEGWNNSSILLTAFGAYAGTYTGTVSNFTAKGLTITGNGNNTGTVTINNGSPTVTGQGTNFPTSIVGGTIEVPQAGSSVPYVGTVQTWNSATSLTLTVNWANPTVTTTPNWTMANQQAGFQNPSGQTLSNFRFEDNEISNVMLGISVNADLGGNVDGVLYQGNHLSNVFGLQTGEGYCLHFANGSTVTVNTVVSYTASNVRILGNHTNNCQRHDIYFARGSGGEIIGNTSENHRSTVQAGTQLPPFEINRSTEVSLVGNIAINPSDGCVSVDSGNLARDNNVLVANNECRNVGGFYPIVVGTTNPATDGFPAGVTITNNRIWEDQSVSGGFGGSVITVQSGKRVNVNDNDIYALNLANGTSMFQVAGSGETSGTTTYSDDVQIRNNHVYATLNGGTAYGIEFKSAAAGSGMTVGVRGQRYNGVLNANSFLFDATQAASLLISVVDTLTGGLDVTKTGSIVSGSPLAMSTSVLISPAAPTITGAGCGGTVATISAPNGTGAFDIFTGTAPTSGGCTITMPTSTTGWNCHANHTSAISTTNFIIQQTGALSTTSVTLQLFSDVAAATAPTASDTWRVTCTAN
jgi:hypothetical protein